MTVVWSCPTPSVTGGPRPSPHHRAGTRLHWMLVCAVLASVMATTVVGPHAVAQPPEMDAAHLTGYLEGALRSTRLPGVAAAVVEGDRTTLVAGVGVDGRGGAVTSRTRFRVASLSKSFTAVGVLQLVEDRRIDLDAPVQAYLPDFAPQEATVAARVTVRHLLDQTSGLTDAGYPGIVDDGAADLRTRVALLRTARLAGEPGTRFHYSDLNYQVLGRLVEVVSGVSLERYLDEHVFGPLGMTGTVSVTTAAAGSRLPGLARGHVLLFGCPVARDELDGLLAGSGGVITTAADMARWLGFQTTGRTPDGQALLSPAMLTLSHTPPDGVSGGYAMGWQVVRGSDTGPAMLEHTGVLSTFSAQQALLPGRRRGLCAALQRQQRAGRHCRRREGHGGPAHRRTGTRRPEYGADRRSPGRRPSRHGGRSGAGHAAGTGLGRPPPWPTPVGDRRPTRPSHPPGGAARLPPCGDAGRHRADVHVLAAGPGRARRRDSADRRRVQRPRGVHRPGVCIGSWPAPRRWGPHRAPENRADDMIGPPASAIQPPGLPERGWFRANGADARR
jgi:CubicO group peptidase (beta-lactamase class C family)